MTEPAPHDELPIAEPSPERLRDATFPQAFKGYDRDAVHAFLDRVADWVEQGAAGAGQGAPDMRRELEKVGERTAGILTAAEEAAAKVRGEASDYAVAAREAADDEIRQAQIAANQKVEELIADAESRAERIVDEAVARRRRLNQAITSLLERRDEIAEEAQRLADELLGAVDALRLDEREMTEDEPVAEDTGEEAAEGDLADEFPTEPPRTGRFDPEPTQLVPEDDEHETTVHRAS